MYNTLVVEFQALLDTHVQLLTSFFHKPKIRSNYTSLKTLSKVVFASHFARFSFSGFLIERHWLLATSATSDPI